MSYVFVVEIPDDEMRHLSEEIDITKGPVDVLREKLEPRDYYNSDTTIIMIKEGG
jgi:hypothetical protein